jgi:hypothetical protein
VLLPKGAHERLLRDLLRPVPVAEAAGEVADEAAVVLAEEALDGIGRNHRATGVRRQGEVIQSVAVRQGPRRGRAEGASLSFMMGDARAPGSCTRAGLAGVTGLFLPPPPTDARRRPGAHSSVPALAG